MTFQTVVIQREDGDFEAVAAFNTDILESWSDKSAIQFAQEFKIFLNGLDGLKDAQVMEFENVTDVIEEHYTIEQSKPVKALWDYQLKVTCPHCQKNVEVTDCETVQEFVLQEMQGVIVECPECSHDFKIDMVM